MKKSRLMARTKLTGVWSIVCLFIKKSERRKGYSTKLIRAAVQYAFDNGANTVESYPIIIRVNNFPDAFAFPGINKAYEKAGFKVVEQTSATRCIMQVPKEKWK